MRDTERIAKLSHKQRSPYTNRYTVRVECSGCGNVERLSFAGWSAMICRGCGCTLQRGTYEAQP